MASNDPRYAAVNARSYPPLTRLQSYVFAHQLLAKLGAPRHCAVQGIDELTGQGLFPARRVLMNIFSRYTGGSKRLGRTCWASTKPTTGHHKGWGRLIHDVSHMLHEYRHPSARPHAPGHDAIEREVADCVDRNGMLERSHPKPRLDATQRRSSRMIAAQEKLLRWERKRKRAETAIKKLKRQLTAMNRRQAKALNIEVGTPVTGAGVPEGSFIVARYPS